MREDSNWVKARSSIVWIAALLVAFGAVWWIEQATRLEATAKAAPAEGRPRADLPPPPTPRELLPQERQAAAEAWAWFERNDARPATAWDAGSKLIALLAARRLGLVTESAFDQRVARVLASLPVPRDATEAARLLVPLHVLAWHSARHAEAARRAVAGWDLALLATQGVRPEVGPYAARALALAGHDLGPQDAGNGEAWLLAGLEFGLAGPSRERAWRALKQGRATDASAAAAWNALFPAAVVPNGPAPAATATDPSPLNRHALVLESLAFVAHGRLLDYR